jgi:hypothetical protein
MFDAIHITEGTDDLEGLLEVLSRALRASSVDFTVTQC